MPISETIILAAISEIPGIVVAKSTYVLYSLEIILQQNYLQLKLRQHISLSIKELLFALRFLTMISIYFTNTPSISLNKNNYTLHSVEANIYHL